MNDGDAHQPRGRSPFQRSPSIPAIVISALLVLGAVAFGILGPTVAGRLSHGGGLPLADVLAAAADLRYRVILDTLEAGDGPDLAIEEAKGALRQSMGRQVALPDLAGMGFHLQRVGPVSLPGANFRSAVAVWRGRGDAQGRWILLFVVADEGQFLAFDALGRPRHLSPDQTLENDLPGRESLALVWSDGAVLHLACFETVADADATRGALGAP